ncbi:Uu.00g067670.m01.CDS01 [Anthostomella pinea]|uniref:Uu.00g067670.m01.CDS01 n=1 Tax=Anthostomella pinea TaxID=933095 RepID=A0AAI8VU60_9PEZI|nr:Uu.00g067670.m01.CDS01 [Anthostomella pinea]
MSLNHPTHPATVHWPLAFLTAAYGLDTLHTMYSYVPSAITSYFPASAEMPRIAYYALSAGLLTSIPSVVTGIANAAQMVQSQGMYEADGKTLKPKMKVIIAHALSNDVIIALSGYIWYLRNQSSSLNLTYAPQSWMVGVEAVMGLALLYSANLGGTLVYNYGMGLRMGSKNKSS